MSKLFEGDVKPLPPDPGRHWLRLVMAFGGTLLMALAVLYARSPADITAPQSAPASVAPTPRVPHGRSFSDPLPAVLRPAGAPSPAPAIAAKVMHRSMHRQLIGLGEDDGGDLRTVNGVVQLSWDVLAGFTYRLAQPATQWQPAIVGTKLPDRITALDGKVVTFDAFMLPVEIANGKATRFALVPGLPGCCFGGNVRMVDYVLAEAAAPGFDYVQYEPVRVVGKFSVGLRERGGRPESIYRMIVTDLHESD